MLHRLGQDDKALGLLERLNLKALPDGQRQLISLVLWKLLASSTHAIAGALETMAKRLQGVLNETPVVADLAEAYGHDEIRAFMDLQPAERRTLRHVNGLCMVTLADDGLSARSISSSNRA